jgi:hypothetical protein
MKARLTPRDTKLFQLLVSFGLLSTYQIGQLVFPGIDYRTVLRRLRKLEHAQLIQRTNHYRGGASVWYLTGTGARRIGAMAHIKTLNKNVLEHDLTANDIRIKLASLRMIPSWKSAHQIKHECGISPHPLSKELDSIPDWLCVINSWTGQHNLAIEVELSYKGPERMKNIFYSYMREGRLQHIWYFVPTDTMGLKLAELVERLGLRDGRDHTWFLWSIIPDALSASPIPTVSSLQGEIPLEKLFVLATHRSAHSVGIQKIDAKYFVEATA